MVTLYDQEKVMEIHDYNTRMAGRQEGREEGIAAMVSTLKAFKIDKAVVVEEIRKRFHVPLQIAEMKVEQYWEQQ